MYIANELKNVFHKENIDGLRDNFTDNLFEIISKYFLDKTLFGPEDFVIHYLDEFILNTNCNDDIFTNVYIEINQPNNYKPSTNLKKKIKLNKNNEFKYQIPELYLSLSDIKKGLYSEILNHFDNNNIVWMDKYGICMKSTILDTNNQSQSFYFRIIPALTFYNKNDVSGLVYYSNNDIQIEYPDKFKENFNKKNKQTKDKFRQTILIFKNILLKEKNIERLPFEIIETLIYNAPNEMLKSDDLQSMINLVNFLRNNPLKSFRTIDEQDYAFSSIYRSMSIFYCKHVLKIIERYLTKS